MVPIKCSNNWIVSKNRRPNLTTHLPFLEMTTRLRSHSPRLENKLITIVYRTQRAKVTIPRSEEDYE